MKDYPEFIITDENPDSIAQQVLGLYGKIDQYDPQALRNLVVGSHDRDSYVQKIVTHLYDIRRN